MTQNANFKYVSKKELEEEALCTGSLIKEIKKQDYEIRLWYAFNGDVIEDTVCVSGEGYYVVTWTDTRDIIRCDRLDEACIIIKNIKEVLDM